MHLIHAFIESYQNGFYTMQTPFETAAAYLGNVCYYIVHFFGGK